MSLAKCVRRHMWKSDIGYEMIITYESSVSNKAAADADRVNTSRPLLSARPLKIKLINDTCAGAPRLSGRKHAQSHSNCIQYHASFTPVILYILLFVLLGMLRTNVHGSECWVATTTFEQKPEVFTNKCLRSILKLFWPCTICKED